MSFTLHNFESYVSSEIVDRGRNYWKKGNVEETTETAPGEWFAMVQGSERYEVEIKVSGSGEIKSWLCDCPYDGGDVCKHVVAVLFELKNEPSDDGKKESSKTKPAASKKDAVDEILSKLTPEQWRPWLAKALIKNADLKADFLKEFGSLASGGPAAQYKTIVATMIKSYSYKGKSKGYMEYRESQQFGRQVSNMLNEAERQRRKPDGLVNFIALCIEVLRQLSGNYDGADDSSGDYGGAMQLAFAYLLEVVKETATPAFLIDDIRRFALEEGVKGAISHYDYEHYLPVILIEAIRAPADADLLLGMFKEFIDLSEQNSKKGKNFTDKYDLQRHVRYVIDVLEKAGRQAEANAFFDRYTHLSDFREKAIQKAFSAKDYGRVRDLANGGLESDVEYAGLIGQWREWLLKVRRAVQDTDGLAQDLERRFLADREMKDYEELKGLLPKELFSKKVEAWIAHFKSKRNEDYILKKIYISAERWKDLFHLLADRPYVSLDSLVENEKYLGARFPEPYVQLFEKEIRREIDNANSSPKYQDACKYLSRVGLYGGPERLKKFINQLKLDFSNRRALLSVLETTRLEANKKDKFI